MSDHMKRIAIPRSWPLKKKAHVFTTKQSAGAHSLETSMPVITVLRDILGVCDTAKEAKRIVGNRDVFVDGKAVKNPKAPVGLMDVLSIPKLDADYRVLLTPRGKLTLVKIEKDEASWKLCRIEDKTVVKGGKIQLNLHDGRNILLDKNDYKTGDVLKVAFDGQKILEAYPLAAGAAALVSSGNHAGLVETVEEYEVIKGSAENVIKFKSGTETVKSNVFVIGAAAPAIKMPEAEN
jgi:small subunit ribosomal protein S4e